MLTFEYATNPEWGDLAETVVNLMVKWVEFPDPMPFSASPLDTEAHGRLLYADAIAGEFGPIGPYVPAPTYFSTESNTLFFGTVFDLGEAVTLNPGDPEPLNFTSLIPPGTETWNDLYWYNDSWIISSFDPSLALINAQAFLITTVNENAAEQGNNEARIYSTAQLFAAADVDALLTADYPLVTLGDYQIFLDGQVTTLEATINAATTTEDLYDFDPTVSGVYTPL